MAQAAVAAVALTDGDLVARRLIDLRRRAELETQKRAERKRGEHRGEERAEGLFFRDYHGTLYFFRNGPGQAALRIQPIWAKQAFEWRFNQAHIWESRYNINLLRVATVPNYSYHIQIRIRNNLGVSIRDQQFCNRLQIPFLEIKPEDKTLHPVTDLHARLLDMYRAMTLHAEENQGFWRVKRSDSGVHNQRFVDSHIAILLFHPVLNRHVIFLYTSHRDERFGHGWTGPDERRAIQLKVNAAFVDAEDKYPAGRERHEGAARDVERTFAENNCVMMTFPPCEFGVATLYAKHRDGRYALEVGGVFLSQDYVDHWIPQRGGKRWCPCCEASRTGNVENCPVHLGPHLPPADR